MFCRLSTTTGSDNCQFLHITVWTQYQGRWQNISHFYCFFITLFASSEAHTPRKLSWFMVVLIFHACCYNVLLASVFFYFPPSDCTEVVEIYDCRGIHVVHLFSRLGSFGWTVSLYIWPSTQQDITISHFQCVSNTASHQNRCPCRIHIMNDMTGVLRHSLWSTNAKTRVETLPNIAFQPHCNAWRWTTTLNQTTDRAILKIGQNYQVVITNLLSAQLLVSPSLSPGPWPGERGGTMSQLWTMPSFRVSCRVLVAAGRQLY